MARLFSIDFEYEQQRYTALVSLCNGENGGLSFTVAPTDEYIRKLLPNGKVQFSNPQEIGESCYNSKLHHLVLSLASAVQQKMYADGVPQR